MILYFSASGNSRWCARRLAELLGDKAVSVLEFSPEEIDMSGETLGFVFPVYSWGVTPLVTQYIHSLNEAFLRRAAEAHIWMVATCGDDVAYAPEMIKDALADVGLSLSSGWSLQMPNTYVLLPGFDVDSKDVEDRKLQEAELRIEQIAKKISSRVPQESYVRGGMPWIKSKVVFPLFVKMGITPSKWHADDSCVGCGRCAAICPMSNIEMRNTEEGRMPEWGKECISCLACYHVCPRHAVQYGRITRGKGQYLHP